MDSITGNSGVNGWVGGNDDGEDAKTSKKQRPELNHGGLMVEINVGSGNSKKQYHIHRNLATYHSPIFDKAFNGNFIEAGTQLYNLIDFEFPNTFGLVLQWMHTATLGRDWAAGDISIEDLYKVWVLADRILMPYLQDFAAASLCYHSFKVDYSPGPLAAVAWVYEETALDSLLRKLFTYKCAYGVKWEEAIKAGNYEILAEMISKIGSIYKRDAMSCKKGDRCVHSNDSGCGGNSWTNSNPPCHHQQCDSQINPSDYHINKKYSCGW